MYFNSTSFFFFLSVVYAFYLVLDHRRQNVMLLVASYIFYAYWDWRFLSLLWISTLVDYHCAKRIAIADATSVKKRYLRISILVNLGMLGFFKYFDFFSESFSILLDNLGFQVNPWTLSIILPVGISFYTFQSMGYTIDVYRGRVKPSQRLDEFALFVAFFPQLVAGPIERVRRLLPQIERSRTLKTEQIREGIFLIAWGLYKKIAIADNLAPIVNHYFSNYETLGSMGVLLGLYAFIIQVYCDFSGYSDIARGIAKLLGFELMVNFRLPFFARNPSEFWQRWHISLSSWIRDYLFLELGTTRGRLWRRNINSIFTMTIMGLWHGAAWHFILWGTYFGIVQSAYNFIRRPLRRIVRPSGHAMDNTVKIVSMLLMFHTFVFSAIFFRAESIGHTVDLLETLFSGAGATNTTVWRDYLIVLFYIAPLFLMQIAQYRSGDLIIFLKQSSIFRFTCYAVILNIIVFMLITGGAIKGGEEFIYFQF